MDHLQVLLQGRPQRLLDVKVPALAEDGDHIGGLEKSEDLWVV